VSCALGLREGETQYMEKQNEKEKEKET